MKITWLGHSALKIEGTNVVLIDPFLTGNPKAATSADEISRADIIVVTHDHGDHLGDSFAIAKKCQSTLVAIYEITSAAAEKGIAVEPMNIGGSIKIKETQISLVPAFHSAGLGGTAVGVIVEMDKKTIYHTGDTGVALEMQLIAELYRPEIVFLPIDGRFNMTPRLAAKAVQLLQPKIAVPIHYDTFPLIHSHPEEFKSLAQNYAEIKILQPGEALQI